MTEGPFQGVGAEATVSALRGENRDAVIAYGDARSTVRPDQDESAKAPLVFSRSEQCVQTNRPQSHNVNVAGTPERGVHPSWVPLLTDPVRFTVLQVLCKGTALTAAELSRSSHISERAVRRQLEGLVAMGLVQEHQGERDGLTPGRPPSRFALHPGARRKLEALIELLSEPLAPAPR
jgi:hypothetical protein